MPPHVATLLFVLGIFGLLALDRDQKARTSNALWIPVIWLSIAGSRSVSQWFNMAPDSSSEQYLDGSPLDRNIWLALIALAILVLARRAQRVTTVIRANLPLFLFYCYCALSIVWSDYPGVAFKRWMKYVGDLSMALIVLTEPDVSAAIKRLLARVGFLLIPLSILLIKYYGDLGRSFDSISGDPMYIGVTMGKNLLGSICMLYGIGAAWQVSQLLRTRRRDRKLKPLIAQCILLGMVLWLFWRANAMTSLSCFLMASGLIAFTTFSKFGRKKWAVHSLVALMVSICFCTLFLNLGTGMLETIGRDPTLTGRTEIWHEVIGMTPSGLFGAGFESFWLGTRLEKIWSLHWWHPNEAHNGYIETYLNLGWIGVMLLATVLVTGYQNAVAAYRRDPATGKVRLAYFVIGVVFNFTEAAFKTLSSIWIMFLLAVIAVPKAPVRKIVIAEPVNPADTFLEGQLQEDSLLSQRA